MLKRWNHVSRVTKKSPGNLMPSLKSFDSKKKKRFHGNIGFVELLQKPYLNLLFWDIQTKTHLRYFFLKKKSIFKGNSKREKRKPHRGLLFCWKTTINGKISYSHTFILFFLRKVNPCVLRSWHLLVKRRKSWRKIFQWEGRFWISFFLHQMAFDLSLSKKNNCYFIMEKWSRFTSSISTKIYPST